MSRKLSNWLETYMEYTEHTESAEIFHKWVGLSMVSAVLQKKCWFNFGRLRIYPNMYVILVARPGIARKTQAISYGVRLISEIAGISLSADSITREALIQDIELASIDEPMEDGTTFTHSSLTVISREFESFIGQKKDNTKMLVLLTDLFDCEELPWKYRTKGSGTNTAPAVYVNMIGATTPESLASSLPSSAIGGGLTSRIVFVWAGKAKQRIAVPRMSDKVTQLKPLLLHDLSVMSRCSGVYDFTPESEAEWTNWYNNFDDVPSNRICKDHAFDGWYSRKPMYIIKLATVLTAVRTNERLVHWPRFLEAMTFLEEVERYMGRAFAAVGRSEITSDVDLVCGIVRQSRIISEKALLQLVWRDIDSKKFDNVISTAIRSGSIKREFKGPKGEPAIHYIWIGRE